MTSGLLTDSDGQAVEDNVAEVCVCAEDRAVGLVCTNIRRQVRIRRRQHSTGWTTVCPLSADGQPASQTRTMRGVSA